MNKVVFNLAANNAGNAEKFSYLPLFASFSSFTDGCSNT